MIDWLTELLSDWLIDYMSKLIDWLSEWVSEWVSERERECVCVCVLTQCAKDIVHVLHMQSADLRSRADTLEVRCWF